MGILKFPLPEERESFYYAQHGIDYSIVIDELDAWLREMYKYQNFENISIEEVRAKLFDLKKERNLE